MRSDLYIFMMQLLKSD